MNAWLAFLLVIFGVLIVVVFSGRLVRGVVGTSRGFGMSTFLVSVIFIGFDPENMAVGATGSYEQVAGISLGSIIGAAMVAMALAFGITAVIAPMQFEKVPKPVLGVPIVAVVTFGIVAVDGTLSRLDGLLLLVGYALAILFLVWLSRKGVDIEAAARRRELKIENKWKAAGLMVLAIAAIIVGSELLVEGSKTLIESIGISDTYYGMVILALLVSIEEVARELPAARRGHPEISFGNIVGSALAFFLFNGGVIALVRPVEVAAPVRQFYLPVAFITVIAISFFMWRKAVSRWAGAVLILLYAIFVVGGYFVSKPAPAV